MSAQIQFFGGYGAVQANNLAGSGCSFFNSGGFSTSLPVGTYNGRTFITDSTGTQNGGEISNTQYLSPSTVILGQVGSGISLLSVPNYLAMLNIHFVNSSPVQTQNVTLYGYDRVNFSNQPSGILLWSAEVIHPWTNQVSNGSGSSVWTPLGSGGTTMAIQGGAGTSGQHINGTSTIDSVHDFYINLSASPTTVGAKLFAVAVSLEYL